MTMRIIKRLSDSDVRHNILTTEKGASMKCKPRYAIGLPLLVVLAVVVIGSCSLSIGGTDTTPPTITSVSTSPSVVHEDHPFTLVVSAVDPESQVTTSVDMNGDGVFGDSKYGIFPTTGVKSISVKASSAGGTTTEYYSLTVYQVVLGLSFSYTTASSYSSSGDFITDYTITNDSNVPITISGTSYIFWGSSGPALTDILITSDTLLNGTVINPGSSVAAQRDGNSFYGTAYWFDYSFTFDDGYGNGMTSSFVNGAFDVY